MVVDDARADEQLSSDLSVRGPLCREAGDLRFLRGQVVARLDGAFAGALAGRLELDPRALSERLHAELREQLVGAPQLLAGV